MSTSQLEVPANAVDTMLTETRRHGGQLRETGGLLLTTPGSGEVRVLAVAGTEGVRRGRGAFSLHLSAIDAIFSFAEARSLRVAAMWHTHQDGAYLSRVDQTGGLRVPGFTSVVLPRFANPPSNLLLWGWWAYDGQAWRATPPGRSVPSLMASVVTFDARGAREH